MKWAFTCREKEYFTLDVDHSILVTDAFVRLYEQGLVYRDTRLVNWCCHLQTVISDIEIEHVQVSGPTTLQLPGGVCLRLGNTFIREYLCNQEATKCIY